MFRLDVADRRDGSENTGIADQDVELAEALIKRCPQLIDGVEFLDIQRHQQAWLTAGIADRIIDLFQPTDRTRGQDQLGTFGGKAPGDSRSDPAGGTGDQGNTTL